MATAGQMGKDLATRRETGQNGAPAAPGPPESLPDLVRRQIKAQAQAFEAVLPAGDATRFARLVVNAVKATPKLMTCFGTTNGQASVLLCAMQAAGLGLEPNTPLEHCWLLPRKNREGEIECELQIGYKGYIALAQRTGRVKMMDAVAVHERDHFVWKRSFDGDVLDHEEYDGDEDPGRVTHAYARVFFLNGGYAYRVLNRRQIEKRRAMSPSWKNDQTYKKSNSPWSTWEEEMAMKSAVRALRPFLDLSAEINRAFDTDERPLRFNADAGAIEAKPTVGELGTGEVVDAEQVGQGDGQEPAGAAPGTPEVPQYGPGEEPFE